MEYPAHTPVEDMRDRFIASQSCTDGDCEAPHEQSVTHVKNGASIPLDDRFVKRGDAICVISKYLPYKSPDIGLIRQVEDEFYITVEQLTMEAIHGLMEGNLRIVDVDPKMINGVQAVTLKICYKDYTLQRLRATFREATVNYCEDGFKISGANLVRCNRMTNIEAAHQRISAMYLQGDKIEIITKPDCKVARN